MPEAGTLQANCLIFLAGNSWQPHTWLEPGNQLWLNQYLECDVLLIGVGFVHSRGSHSSWCSSCPLGLLQPGRGRLLSLQRCPKDWDPKCCLEDLGQCSAHGGGGGDFRISLGPAYPYYITEMPSSWSPPSPPGLTQFESLLKEAIARCQHPHLGVLEKYVVEPHRVVVPSWVFHPISPTVTPFRA